MQIGNAITEKMVLDVMLAARDRGLYHAITDCGAGGFSSAVGEMGEKIGAEVWLDRAPLKYDGLSLHRDLDLRSPGADGLVRAAGEVGGVSRAVPQPKASRRRSSASSCPPAGLKLKYDEHEVADLAMEFLHDGRPPVVREAVYEPPRRAPLRLPRRSRGDHDRHR